MHPHMEIPATLAARGVPKTDLAGASLNSESTSPSTRIQAANTLARQLFGRSVVVERKPLARFRKRAPSPIRAWRAPA